MTMRTRSLVGLAACLVTSWLLAPVAAAPQAAEETNVTAGFVSSQPLARGLVQIGEVGIAKQDDIALRAYFSPDFRVHSVGTTRDVEQIIRYFASLRAAFPDLTVTREFVIVEGRYVGARTRFSGTFRATWKGSPLGDVAPTNRRVTWAVNNIFRYTPDDRLAEEWVEYDIPALRRQLGLP